MFCEGDGVSAFVGGLLRRYALRCCFIRACFSPLIAKPEHGMWIYCMWPTTICMRQAIGAAVRSVETEPGGGELRSTPGSYKRLTSVRLSLL